MNSAIKALVGSVILLIVALIGRSAVLGGVPVVTLSSAPPLAGAISQSLTDITSGPQLPKINKDYKITNVSHYDNSNWVVATVELVNSQTDPATVVLHKNSGQYQVVLGPGTSFPSDYISGLPDEVVRDLTNRGVLYEPTE